MKAPLSRKGKRKLGFDVFSIAKRMVAKSKWYRLALNRIKQLEK